VLYASSLPRPQHHPRRSRCIILVPHWMTCRVPKGLLAGRNCRGLALERSRSQGQANPIIPQTLHNTSSGSRGQANTSPGTPPPLTNTSLHHLHHSPPLAFLLEKRLHEAPPEFRALPSLSTVPLAAGRRSTPLWPPALPPPASGTTSTAGLTKDRLKLPSWQKTLHIIMPLRDHVATFLLLNSRNQLLHEYLRQRPTI
jgi:hypothetical protein